MTLGLQRLADAIGWEGEHSDLSGLVRVSLARLLWALTAMALALDRVELLPLLNRIALPVRYGTASVAAVADTTLRYLAFYEGSAGKTYEALSEWFASLGTLVDYKLLTIRDGLTPAFAEADLILGLRLLAERERDVYCEGAALDSRPAEQRLIRRLADPAQVPTLAAFYGVKAPELTELLAERYAKVAPRGRGVAAGARCSARTNAATGCARRALSDRRPIRALARTRCAAPLAPSARASWTVSPQRFARTYADDLVETSDDYHRWCLTDRGRQAPI